MKFLVSGFVINIGNSGYFHTLTRVLLVHVLKGIFIEVNGSWSETLGRHLCLLIRSASNLTGESFEALTYFLCCQQLINCSAIMRRT